METAMRQKKSNRRKAAGQLAGLLLALAFAAGAVVMTGWLDYWAANQEYRELEEAYITTLPPETGDGSTETTAGEAMGMEGLENLPVDKLDKGAGQGPGTAASPAPGGPDPISLDPGRLVPNLGRISGIDWDGLQALNPEIVAWIEIPGTNISYPVLFRAGDSEYYLTHTVTGTLAKQGAVHLDGASDGVDSRNLLIYGHNLADGTMFSALNKYKNVSFYRMHPYIYFYLPDGSVHVFQVVAVILTEGTDKSLYMADFADMGSAQAYYGRLLEQAIYETGMDVDASEKRQTLLLSTCYRKGYKRLVFAVETG